MRTELGDTFTITGNVNDGAALLQATINGSGSGPAAPTIASWSPDSGVVGDGITNVNTPTLKGSAAASSTVTVYDGSTKLGVVTASSTGAWSFTTAKLSDGTHVLTTTDTTSAGVSAASSALNITVDTHVPAAPVESTCSIVNSNHVLVSGTAEANSAIAVRDGTTVVGTAATSASGAWSLTTSALAKRRARPDRDRDGRGGNDQRGLGGREHGDRICSACAHHRVVVAGQRRRRRRHHQCEHADAEGLGRGQFHGHRL